MLSRQFLVLSRSLGLSLRCISSRLGDAARCVPASRHMIGINSLIFFLKKSLLLGASLQAVCAIIVRIRYHWANSYGLILLQVALVGHFTLAPSGTPTSMLTARNKSGGGVVIAFAVFQVFIFGTTWGPTPWVYLGESFPLRVRPKSIALGSASSTSASFLPSESRYSCLSKTGSGISCFHSSRQGLLLSESELQSKLLGCD
jgi:hypothetical protein